MLLCFWSNSSFSDQPTKKDDADKVYRNLLTIYCMYAKKVCLLLGGHGLALWSIMGFLPVWLRKFRVPPKHNHKNIRAICDNFGFEINNQQQSQAFFDAVKSGISHRYGYELDANTVENLICKYGRRIRHCHTQWKVWCFPRQILFNAYDEQNMKDESTKNNIIALFHDGTKQNLHRPSIIGGWVKKKGDGTVLQYNIQSLSALFINCVPEETSKPKLKKSFQDAVDNIVSVAYKYERCQLANQLSQVFPVLDKLNNLPSLTPDIQNESSLQIYQILRSNVHGYV